MVHIKSYTVLFVKERICKKGNVYEKSYPDEYPSIIFSVKNQPCAHEVIIRVLGFRFRKIF